MIIGITGKSGSGKTTITDLLNRDDKYEIIHVDDITHLILELDEVKELLISKYGEFLRDKDNSIDRKKLGSILFQDDQKMAEYNELIYVHIERYIDGIIASSEKDIIIDWMQLPLSKYFTMSKFNILVDVPLEIRLKRLLKRDGVNRDYLLKREKHAVDYDKKLFDYVIINDENDMDKKIEKIGKQLERK